MSEANSKTTNLTLDLEDGWVFTQLSGNNRNQPSNRGTDTGEWLPTKIPTGVHEELLKLSRIPDPFVGLNEHLVQWIGEETWAFQTKFTITAEMHALPNVDLVFDGLDTYATVELDGKKVLETNNMFVPYRVPIKDALSFSDAATEHSLLITFHPTFLKGRSLQRENADKTPAAIRGGGSTGGAGVMQGASNQIPGPNGELALWNGDASRLHVRKAQYHYGWDWGPVLMCVGPWKPIRLESYQLRIAEMRTEVDIPETLDNATVKVSAELAGASSKALTATLTLTEPVSKTETHSTVEIASGANSVQLEVQISDPKLWHPVGQGQQSLYTASLQIKDSNQELAKSEKRIGLRRVQIVRRGLKEQDGESFFFAVNGQSLFAGGSNWIPADSFLTNISPDRYRAWLQLLVDGNQNMVRVWERVSAEVEANVKRLRHHPSIVIWAGNNEDYAVAEAIPLELDYSVEWPSVDFRKTSFPARYIYEVLLPEMITKHAPDMYYHRGSPYSGSGKRSDDKQYGDVHQWNVWHVRDDFSGLTSQEVSGLIWTASIYTRRPVLNFDLHRLVMD
ncbi:hypothetical protein FRC16_008878 [Serendipita sp. 398]|nr:hypothetical protein FRC16_008878 [Serendipita sp. 398]